MDEDKLADLNDIQDFFNRSHSTSASETFCTESIGIKDFIGWCNNPCNSKPKGNDDDADGLGKTVCMLEKLDDDIVDKIYSILEDTSVSVVGDTDVTISLLRTKRVFVISWPSKCARGSTTTRRSTPN